MKIRRRLIATIALAAAVLTGCGDEDTAKDEAAQAHVEGLSDVFEAQQLKNDREAHEAISGAESSPESKLVGITGPDEAKEQALAEGRPEAAWDKYCVAWELPEPSSADDQWVNDVTQAYLDHHDAACPDAIVHPHYYADSFAAGEPGEIVITLEDAALTEYFVRPNSDGGLQHFGFGFFEATFDSHPELEMVTVTVEDTDRSWTTTPAQYERGVLTANQVSEVWPSFSGDGIAFENAWAQQQLKTFMRYQGANSLEGFTEGSPERNITAVTNPEPGVVRFEVRDLDYEANGWDLDFMAINFMSYTGCASSDVDAVIVETVSGARSTYLDHC